MRVRPTISNYARSTLYCSILYFILYFVVYYIKQYHASSYYIILHCIILHCVSLCHILIFILYNTISLMIIVSYLCPWKDMTHLSDLALPISGTSAPNPDIQNVDDLFNRFQDNSSELNHGFPKVDEIHDGIWSKSIEISISTCLDHYPWGCSLLCKDSWRTSVCVSTLRRQQVRNWGAGHSTNICQLKGGWKRCQIFPDLPRSSQLHFLYPWCTH